MAVAILQANLALESPVAQSATQELAIARRRNEHCRANAQVEAYLPNRMTKTTGSWMR